MVKAMFEYLQATFGFFIIRVPMQETKVLVAQTKHFLKVKSVDRNNDG